MAVVVPFGSPEKPSIDPLVDLVSADMDRVNSVILTRDLFDADACGLEANAWQRRADMSINEF